MTQRTLTWHHWALILILGLFIIRLTGMFLSPLGLHGDEAQYWSWSKTLDWGYFTKPPMIAWVIFATTSVFGDAEWAVRLSSPLLHSVTAYVIFRTARFAFDARTGFWAAAIYLLMPALWLSSGIVSTDVPLLLCWAVALNAWLHLREKASWPRAIQLGVAVGLGIMAKYAMLFFLPALGLAFLFDGPSRKSLNTLKGYSAGLITALIITPNILWNMSNDFATLNHTVANANIQSGIPFYPGELATFWLDQLGVFGPVTLILLILALIAAMKGRLGKTSFWIAAFVISPLLIISVEALISRANANWAVTAYVAAPILTAKFCTHYWPKAKKWLVGSLAVQSVICAVFVGILMVPSWTDAAGLTNSVKRLRAWPETVDALEKIYAQGHEGKAFEAIALDKRIVFYDLKYYGLDETAPVFMWMRYAHPENHAELSYPLPPMDGPVLLIKYYDPGLKIGREDYGVYMEEDFERLVRLSVFDQDLGGGKRREYVLLAGYGYAPTKTR